MSAVWGAITAPAVFDAALALIIVLRTGSERGPAGPPGPPGISGPPGECSCELFEDDE